jgi:hypothetical protein
MCIYILIKTLLLLDRRITATTKKLDFKNSHIISVGANPRGRLFVRAMAQDPTGLMGFDMVDKKNFAQPERRR